MSTGDLTSFAATGRGAPPWWRMYALGWAPLAIGYFVVLALFIRISGAELVAAWASNVVAPFVMGAGVFRAASLLAPSAPLRTQILAHVAGSTAFTSIWALALFRGLQVHRGLTSGDWSFDGFAGPVLAWQLFQGLAIYFLIVGWAYAYAFQRLAARDPVDPGQGGGAPVRPNRLFVRTPEAHVPVDFHDIISIVGAPAGARLRAASGSFDARTTLAELETDLGGYPFVRIHRSTIVNAERIRAIEPAGGGRLIAHMDGGDSHETSRAGATALKSIVRLAR